MWDNKNNKSLNNIVLHIIISCYRYSFHYAIKVIVVVTAVQAFLSCTQKQTDSPLVSLTLKETLTRLNNGDVQFYYATYKDSVGGDLTSDLRQKLTSGQLKREFFINENDSIKEIRVRFLKDSEIFDEIQLRSAMSFPLSGLKFENIDCKKLQGRIKTAINNDQQVRFSDTNEQNIFKIDTQNKSLIISIIEKCGWLSIDTAQINDVFLLIQHMDSNIMARYYPVFIEYYKVGALSNLNFARMIDRLLMNNGFEQIYGTQVVDQSFYNIKDVKNVNKRQQELGLSSIEEAARRFGFEYKLNQNLKD
jgi:hypothetical protein